MHFLRSKVAGLVVLGSVVGLGVSLLMHLIPWIPAADSTQATRVDLVIWGITYVSFVIFGLVMAVMLYSVWRWRRRDPLDERDGPPVHGHTGLELFWTAIPVLIVVVFGVWAGIILNRNEAHATDVRVIVAQGFRYGWNYIYRTDGGFTTNQMVVPVNQNLEIQTDSIDVIHDFFVPEWRVKSDALPGGTGEGNRQFVTPTKIGTYHPLCAELCGPGHAQMGLTAAPVRVVSEADFARWLEQQKKSSNAAPPGEKVFTSAGCAGCHTYQPARSTGKIGPDLDNLSAAAKDAGKQLPDFVRESIVQPNQYIAKGYQPNIMPEDYAKRLSAKEIDDLVAFLTTSKSPGGSP